MSIGPIRIKAVREAKAEAAIYRGPAYRKGLCDDAAHAIAWCACGITDIVEHLSSRKPNNSNEVIEYVESIGCLREDAMETMCALTTYLDKQKLAV